MEFDVTIDRDKYIGGSDIPVIMGISSFKTRYQLLLEKAGIESCDFAGNKYTEYGHTIEPKIREYINGLYNTCFEPNRVIDGDMRFHTDGFDGSCVLEIKSTSHIYDKVDEYKHYLVQLVKYMDANNVGAGVLAVYERPEDMSEEFDSGRLQIFDISINDYLYLLQEIDDEIERFRTDLERIKKNPLLCEEDFQPDELVVLSGKVVSFEAQLARFKEIEAQYKAMKQQLYEAMERHGVTSWTTAGDVRITRVAGKEATVETVEEFNADKLKEEQPDIYQQYVEQKQKKVAGRSGYVKITMPK